MHYTEHTTTGTRLVLADGILLRPVQLRAALAVELDLPPQKVRDTLAQRLRCLFTRSDLLHYFRLLYDWTRTPDQRVISADR